MLDTDLHGGNSFTYSNVQVITNNQHTVDQQFGRFSTFVEAQAEPLRLEMKRFYGPMLCHFYLDLLKAREPRGAVELLRKYALGGPCGYVRCTTAHQDQRLLHHGQ